MQKILKSKRSWALLTIIVVAVVACATTSPLDRLRSKLAPYPEYSVILQDMQTSGNFFTDYEHQYKVVYGVKAAGSEDLTFREKVSDWVRVDRKLYEKYEPYLGMTILTKGADGKVEEAFFPPHYQYVGNERYGQWRRDERGNSFWEFYGKYALLRDVLGGFGRPIYRSDWDDYRGYRSGRRPYFGRNREYGTRGTYTKTSHRTFYQRQEAKQRAKRESFSRKVQSRTRRSGMSGMRSRSGGRGGK